MDQAFVISAWGLTVITATVLWLNRPLTPPSNVPENDGLGPGLRFPFSLIVDRLDPTQRETIQKAKRVAILIAAPSCGTCRPILQALPDLTRSHPDTPLVVLLFGERDIVESAKVEYRLSTPTFAYTAALERALDTHFLPTLYIVGADERIVEKSILHSTDELGTLLA